MDSSNHSPPRHSPSRRRTSRLVRLSDRVAQAVITTGGLGVLAAMLGICVFLFVVAVPLFIPGSASEPRRVSVQATEARSLFATLSSDNAWYALVDASGEGLLIQTQTGRVLSGSPVFTPASPVTASFYERGTGRVFLGHEDGSLSTGVLAVNDGIVAESGIPESLLAMKPGETRALEPDESGGLNDTGSLRFEVPPGSVFERFDDGGRVVALSLSVSDPVQLREGVGPVRRIAGTAANEREQFVIAAREDGSITLGGIRVHRSLSGASARTRVTQFPVTSEPGPVPDWLMTDADGLHVVALWADGRAVHHARESNRSKEFLLVDALRLTGENETVTVTVPALGARSLLVADSASRVSSWTFAPPSERADDAGSATDRREARLTMVSRATQPEPIVAMSTSNQDRTLAMVDAAGSVSLFNMTSLRRVARLPGTVSQLDHLTLSADLNFVAALDRDQSLTTWDVDPGYPEVGWRSLARPIQYEGYNEPKYVYQSTGSPGAQAKMSLVPLIWGTLKATVISMLIATPLAVLAAMYTSEFLHPRLRRKIKPMIELMASLPSVVLGFVAAMLVAPFLRDHLSEILLLMLALPISLMLGSTLIRYVPTRTMRRVSSGKQLTLIGLTLAAGALVAVLLGDPIEATLFANPAAGPAAGSDAAANTGLIPWLNGNYGSATPGWVLATVPLMMVLLFQVWSRFLGRRWGERVSRLPRAAAATGELSRVLGLLVLGVLVGTGLAMVLSAAGLDPRESIFGTYSQRNTLVVGLIMGFAVIPIIYTISEDAMQAVPSGLRSASLGAGATRWQTAVRVVLPVAGSGIFSAVMVGLGRAVGETMIVLMATGNTPEISANIFSGFRTLAANIAVELPEAPRGGTHYRVLFLCGLVLFVMTLIINTSAEIVRQRVRRKNAAL
ncbi:MAG: phosphate transport system permease protein [Phycisphaerales bacterium]|jgi:phosphate transport system permease protein